MQHNKHPLIYKLVHSPREWLYPSCLHTTVASLLSQPKWQTVPHLPSIQISTLPSLVSPRTWGLPFLSWRVPSLHSFPNSVNIERAQLKKSIHILTWYRCKHVTHDYPCIWLQHHRYDHSLSHTDLLQHWSSLTVLILLQYMPHCPTVWVQFHDQSNYWSKQLLLYNRNVHNCQLAFSDWDIAMWNTIRRESKLSACHFGIIGPPWVVTYCPPLSLIAHFHRASSRSGSTTSKS